MKQKKTQNNSKSSRLLLWMAVLIITAGVGVFAYPTFSNYLAEQNQSRVITAYNDQVAQADAERMTAEWEKARVYNENLAGDPVHDPFLLGSGYVLPDNYQDVLNVGGVMATLEIPKIGVELPIYHGTSAAVLKKGVGHLEMTALPIGGTNRHCVLTGHRGLPSAELFTRLDEMEVGDVFYLHVLDQTLAYRVDQINTILPDDLALLGADGVHDWVTLVTCTPYAVNTHRLLVRGERIAYTPEETDGAPGKQTGEQDGLHYYDYGSMGIAAAALLLLGLFFCLLRRRKKKK